MLLQHTVRKMLAKDPVRRYQSIHEVETNLRAILEGGEDSSESAASWNNHVMPGFRGSLLLRRCW